MNKAQSVLSLLLILGALPAACANPAAQAPPEQSAGSPSAAKPSGWNDKPVDGSPGVNPPAISGHNLILKETFKDGKSLPWTTSFSIPSDGEASVQNGELCVELRNVGVNRWDAQLRHRDMVLQKNHTYTVQFMMHATQKTRAYTKIGQAGPPYREYFSQSLDLEPGRQIFKGIFTMQAEDDGSPELAFHLGGNMAKDAKVPFTVCLDDVHIEDPQFTPKAAA
ncbi:MAG: carbohydrate binding domain-containing protein, partial [Myxococcales bacterium]